MSSVQPFETVTGTLLAFDGSPEVGVKLVFDLKEPGQHAGSASSITTARRSVVTDEGGAFSVQLFRTDDDLRANYYTMSRVVAGGLGVERLVDPQNFSVPEGGPFDFAQLVQQFSVQRMGLDEKIAAAAVNARLNADRAQSYRAEIDPDGLEARFSQQVADGVAAMDVALDAHIAQARSEYPAVNLWKNAQATAVDSGGNLLTPLTVATSYSGSTTTVTQRVLVPNHPDLPPEINAALLPDSNLASSPVNCIELTLNQNDGNGKFRLMAFRTLKGKYTAGAAYVQAASDGIRLTDTDLVAGTLYENLKSSADAFFHVNGLFGTVVGNGKKLYVALPYVAAGVLSRPPLFLLDSNYHNAF